MKADDPRIKLSAFRRRIDSIDRKLLALLNQRGKIAQKIGAVKKTYSLAIVEPTREQQVVAQMLAANKGPLPNDAVERLFGNIMIEMRNLQREGKE